VADGHRFLQRSVAATVPHRFHDISEDLEVVVVFAPPET
jgi:hypothetical protein